MISLNNLHQVKEHKWTSKSEQILAAKLLRLENNLFTCKAADFLMLDRMELQWFSNNVRRQSPHPAWVNSESSFVTHLCGTQNAFSCSNNIITVIRSSGQLPSSPFPHTQCCWNIVLHFQRKPIKIMGVFILAIKQHRKITKLKRNILEMLVLEESRFN